MATLTIEIPKEVLKQKTSRRLLVVDPKKFEMDLRRSWEMEDAVRASKLGRQEYKLGKTKALNSLSRLIR